MARDLQELSDRLDIAYEMLDEARKAVDYDLAREDADKDVQRMLAHIEELEYEMDQMAPYDEEFD